MLLKLKDAKSFINQLIILFFFWIWLRILRLRILVFDIASRVKIHIFHVFFINLNSNVFCVLARVIIGIYNMLNFIGRLNIILDYSRQLGSACVINLDLGYVWKDERVGNVSLIKRQCLVFVKIHVR